MSYFLQQNPTMPDRPKKIQQLNLLRMALMNWLCMYIIENHFARYMLNSNMMTASHLPYRLHIKSYWILSLSVCCPIRRIKQLDIGVSPPAFSFTLIVTLSFDPDLDLLWPLTLTLFTFHLFTFFFLVTFFLVFWHRRTDGQTDRRTDGDT